MVMKSSLELQNSNPLNLKCLSLSHFIFQDKGKLKISSFKVLSHQIMGGQSLKGKSMTNNDATFLPLVLPKLGGQSPTLPIQPLRTSPTIYVWGPF